MRTLAVLVAAMATIAIAAHTSIARQSAQPSKDQTLEQLTWMVGSWSVENGGEIVEEHWTPARGNTMLAVGRTTRGDRTVFYEFLRIEQTPGAITYHAAPKGRSPATPFKVVEMTGEKVVFENPQHDFPVRITYWREGADGMGARVEGKDGQGAESWVFKRVSR